MSDQDGPNAPMLITFIHRHEPDDTLAVMEIKGDKAPRAAIHQIAKDIRRHDIVDRLLNPARIKPFKTPDGKLLVQPETRVLSTHKSQ